MYFTEDQLQNFVKPISDSEDKKCENALKIVSNALANAGYKVDDSDFNGYFSRKASKDTKQLKLFVQGSYANDTNIKLDSDVDVAVIIEEFFHVKYREGVTDSNYGFHDAPQPSSVKDEIFAVLNSYTGGHAKRGNKSIKIKGNTYRNDIDVVPCNRYRDYSNDYNNNPDNYEPGIQIKADDGDVIINYPEQHILKGKQKNKDTNYYYKKMVRIIKNIRNIMEEYRYTSAYNMSSFGLESLIYNIPNNVFLQYTTLRYIFDDIVQHLYKNINSLQTYKEANGIKPLCDDYNSQQNYKLFIADLKIFYEYNIKEN